MLKGKIALVTGGARGIGKEIVLKYAENGATVISGDLIDADYTHENVTHVKLNVTDRENIKELAAMVKEKYGRLDVLVNNAGITRDSLLQRMKEDDWDLLIDINLKGVYNVMQGFVSLLLKSKGASVINMASVVGVDGNAGQTNYAASKGGVIAMAKTWAKEFGKKNLRSNAIAPGFIKTDMTHVLPEKLVESVLENTPLKKIMSGLKKSKIYAYYLLDSQESGIFYTWNECEQKVKGKKARYKSFKSEKEAQEWLKSGAEYEKKEKKNENLFLELEKDGIYFDAGTGRGEGVEVRLTDYDGNSLLYEILEASKINKYGNYKLSDGRTNNFGELTGLFAALKYAKKNNIKVICGDSNLVIEYWSKGRYNSDGLEKDTVELIKKVTLLRTEFEKNGGTVKKISGDVNPADLGFHK